MSGPEGVIGVLCRCDRSAVSLPANRYHPTNTFDNKSHFVHYWRILNRVCCRSYKSYCDIYDVCMSGSGDSVFQGVFCEPSAILPLIPPGALPGDDAAGGARGVQPRHHGRQ